MEAEKVHSTIAGGHHERFQISYVGEVQVLAKKTNKEEIENY